MRRLITTLVLAAIFLLSALVQHPAAIVANPRGYTLHFSASPAGFSPADATTYYVGGLFALNPQTAATVQLVPIPRNGTVRRIDLVHRVLGVAGTTEASTVSFRLNNSTDTTITAALDSSVNSSFSTTVSIPVDDNDTFEIKWVTPTWATNPTTVALYGAVFIDVP